MELLYNIPRLARKWITQSNFTSARKISIANPLKQLMTACCMSNPRLSRALIVESKRPGLRPQNMWIFTALPSRNLTSTCIYKQLELYYSKVHLENHICSIRVSIDKGLNEIILSAILLKGKKKSP